MPERVQLWLVGGLVALLPLFAGLPSQFWVAVALLLLAVACLLTPVGRFVPAQRRCLLLIIAAFAAFGFVGIVQILPAFSQAANPIWAKVAALIDSGIVPRISARSAIPTLAIAHCALLLTSLLAGFSLGAGRRSSKHLLATFAWSGAAYAAYGLMAEAIDPSQNLWGPKAAYLGAVTGPFIGRSTAAAYFGVAAIVWATLLTRVVQDLALPASRWLLFVSLSPQEATRVGVNVIAFMVCCAAVLGTKSRAAALFTFAGMVVSIACLYAHDRKRRRLMLIGGLALIGGLVILVDGFEVGRVAAEGLFDPYRWAAYKAEIAAIEAHPWLGTGWGTFALVFPTFRTNDVSIWGIWERAHSTPLELAMEMGLPCAVLVLTVSGILFWRVFRAAISSPGERRFLLSAIVGSALMVLLQTSIDFVVQISILTIVFGTLFGAAVARALAPATR